MRPHLSKAPLLRLMLGLVFGLAACTQSPSPSPLPLGGGSAAQPAPDRPVPAGPVTLALLVPRTAQHDGTARLAQALTDAARMSLEELRDPGIALRVYDTRGQAEGAAQAARAALADGADVILGPLFAAATREAAGVAGPAGLKVISFSTDTAVAGGPVYVSGYTPESEVARILGYARSQGVGAVAVFFPSTDYGDAVMRGVRSAQDRGVRLVTATPYERSFKGIEAASAGFAEQARGLGAQSVLLPAGGRELQAVGSFMNYHRLDPLAVRYLGLGQWDSRASFDEPALRGGWFVAPDPGRMADFGARFRARYGAQPPVLATLGYDAVQIAGALVREARASGGGDPFSDAALTRPEGFRGALGPLRFAPGGRGEHGMAIMEVADRDFIVRDPAPLAFGAGS